MAWTVLIYTQGSHFKYWSYSGNQRSWGRIREYGAAIRNFSESDNQQAYYNKLDEGYVLFSSSWPRHYPTPAEVRDFNQRRLGNQPLPTPERAPRASSTTRQTSTPQTRTRTVRRTVTGIRPLAVPEYNRTHTVPNTESYRTNRTGYINYRKGYTKNLFDSTSSKIVIMRATNFLAWSGNGGSMSHGPELRAHAESAKAYFNRIPATSQYNKPRTFEDMRAPDRPTFFFVFWQSGRTVECVGIYNLNTRTGICDFFAIKNDIPYRATLIRKVLHSQCRVVSSAEMTYKIKPPTSQQAPLLRQIKSIANFPISDTNTTLKYRTIDLKNGVSLPQERPARWIE